MRETQGREGGYMPLRDQSDRRISVTTTTREETVALYRALAHYMGAPLGHLEPWRAQAERDAAFALLQRITLESEGGRSTRLALDVATSYGVERERAAQALAALAAEVKHHFETPTSMPEGLRLVLLSADAVLRDLRPKSETPLSPDIGVRHARLVAASSLLVEGLAPIRETLTPTLRGRLLEVEAALGLLPVDEAKSEEREWWWPESEERTAG